jgi:transcription elongation factor GreA
LKKLEDELETLRSVKRQEVAERIKVAISYGDISENSEYDDAKNEQAFVEGRIIELEKMIRTAKIIDDSAISKEVVTLGSKVTVEDIELKEKETYVRGWHD